MLVILGIILAAASVIVGLTGPVNTWAIIKESSKPKLIPDANHPTNRNLSGLTKVRNFLLSVYTFSLAGISYNLWYSIHLIGKQNGVTVTFVVDLTITVAAIVFQLVLLFIKWTADMTGNTIDGILYILSKYSALMESMNTQIGDLIQLHSSSEEIIGAVQSNLERLHKLQETTAEVIETIANAQTKQRGRKR